MAYYKDNKGYILVRNGNEQMRHGEVRVSKHAASMALSNYIKANDLAFLKRDGCNNDIANAIDWVYAWVNRDDMSLKAANAEFQSWQKSKYIVKQHDLDLVDELREKEFARWEIVEVPVVPAV